MALLYNIGIQLYNGLLHFAALFHPKARLWVQGRKNWRQHLQAHIKPSTSYYWIHCASLGEFEQGRPLIEALQQAFPRLQAIVSFYSPSGYEIQKNYKNAAYVCYLPVDTAQNANDFVAIVQPKMAFFVKYEFWKYYLEALHKAGVPAYLVSGTFRKQQLFFKPYGAFYREMLRHFTAFFVQDQESQRLLQKIGLQHNVYLTGDTRYDRVAHIAEQDNTLPLVESFLGNSTCLIAGSTWPADEALLAQSVSGLPGHWKLLLAPHEIHETHIRAIQKLFPDAVLYSQLENNLNSDARILIIDNIGMLSRLYAYANVVYIGGGFEKGGIHNILEPAVFGNAVIFGPVYKKFVEAQLMVARQLAFSVQDAEQLTSLLQNWLAQPEAYQHLRTRIRTFMQEQMGATQKIIAYLQSVHRFS